MKKKIKYILLVLVIVLFCLLLIREKSCKTVVEYKKDTRDSVLIDSTKTIANKVDDLASNSKTHHNDYKNKIQKLKYKTNEKIANYNDASFDSVISNITRYINQKDSF